MADFDTPTWAFTSADVSTTPITTLQLHVATVRWIGPTDAAHNCILHDVNGNVVWHSEIDSAGLEDRPESHPIADAPNSPWNGLVINQLDSGTLYVTLA